MRQTLLERNNEITISAGDLECANLAGFDCLELHLLNQAAVVIPGEMTAGELIAVGSSLLKLATILVDGLLVSCSGCDNCGQQVPCALKAAEVTGGNLGGAFTNESEYASECSQISPDMQKLLQDRGVCLLNLEEKLQNEAWVYFSNAAGEY